MQSSHKKYKQLTSVTAGKIIPRDLLSLICMLSFDKSKRSLYKKTELFWS